MPVRRIAPEALRLYLVTDEACCQGRDLLDVVREAVAGGVTCVQLREKHLPIPEFIARGRALKALLAPLGIPLIINDRIDVALACQADGVHIGQSDLPFTEARQQLPTHSIIGLSIESLEDLHAAQALDVDYLGISPVFATPTKTDTAAPWGLEGVRRCRQITDIPLVGIGGLSMHNAGSLIDAGIDGIAVVSAICSAPSPRAAAQALAGEIAVGFVRKG